MLEDDANCKCTNHMYNLFSETIYVPLHDKLLATFYRVVNCSKVILKQVGNCSGRRTC